MLKVKQHRVTAGLAKVLAGSVLGQGVGVLCSPLLTRLFTPSDFGALAVFTAVVTMCGAVCTLRLEAAVPLPRSEVRAAAVAWTALGVAAASTVLLVVVGVFAGEFFSAALAAPALAPLWWLVAPTVFVVGAGQVMAAWMVRAQRYGQLARRNVTLGVGQVAVQLVCGVLEWRPIGLLLGLLAGRAAAFGGLGFAAGGLLRLRRPRRKQIRGVFVLYRRFPLVSSWSALLNTAGSQAPLLVISTCYGQAAVGLIALTVRVLATPAAVIGQPVAQVYLGEVSAANRARSAQLGRAVQNTVRRLLIIGLLPAGVLVSFAPSLFAVVFGHGWSEAGHYAQLLSIGYLVEFAVAPVSQTLLLLERQVVQLGWDFSRLVLTTGGPAVCFLLGAPVLTAIAVLSASYVVSYGLLYTYCVRAARDADRACSPGGVGAA